MNYENLPVYKLTFDLLLEVYRRTPRMQRDYRYTLGEEAKHALQDVIACIYQANLRKEGKLVYIPRARDSLVRFKVLFRLMESLNQLSKKDIVLMGDMIADISTQLQKWEAYVRASENKTEKVPQRRAAGVSVPPTKGCGE